MLAGDVPADVPLREPSVRRVADLVGREPVRAVGALALRSGRARRFFAAMRTSPSTSQVRVAHEKLLDESRRYKNY